MDCHTTMIRRVAVAFIVVLTLSGCFSGREKMSTDEGFITTTDQVRLFYRKVGHGSRIVMVPNGLYYFDSFKRFADACTLIFYDVRNRGSSDTVIDKSRLSGGIQQDVEDLEAVRKHFEKEQVDLMGHSYIGLMIGLYAKKYPQHVNRMVQISPAQPDTGIQYPSHLAYVDAVITEVMGKLAKMQTETRPEDPVERCKQFWSVLAPINVYNPVYAKNIDWGRCHLPNERNFMQYWSEHIFPSIQTIHLTSKDLSGMKSPVLILHGDKDRSAPYGGSRDWAMIWPNARLLTLPNVAHAPWIEAPEIVFEAIRLFLDGTWPQEAQKVS